jgi:uncharacterized protein with FMN-binding domain
MLDVLDYGFAWIATLLAVLLAVVFITRKIAQASAGKSGKAARLNRALRKPHIVIGILCVVTGLVHGLASTDTVWSLNVGTVSWVLSLLLGVNFLLRKRLKHIGGWMVYHRILTVLFLASIVWHVVDVGGIRVFDKIAGTKMVAQEEYAKENAVPGEGTDAPASSAANGEAGRPAGSAAATASASASASVSDFQFDGVTLKDGVYTGAAEGFGPNLTVEVTVKEGRVTNVAIVSHNEEKPRYYEYPMEVIPQEIVDSQTTDVDLVSGATFTSTGIVNAVRDALQGAVVSGQLPDPLPLPQNRGHH